MQLCAKRDLVSCEKLATLYVKNEDWDNALLLGEALCGKDVLLGCTYSGMALLAKKNAKQGMKLLNLACDKFEPYACRSLGRIMKSSGNNDLSHIYFRRSCHFGLSEICRDLKKGKNVLSPAGADFIKKLKDDCSDTKASICSERLNLINKCSQPLLKQDCELLPGLLSIFFRSKLIQAEAKFLLTRVFVAEKKLKTDPKFKSYSFDLASVLKEKPSLENYHYVFGFLKACSGQGTSTSLELFPKSYEHMKPALIATIKSEWAKIKGKDCYDPKWGFEAYAVGSLDPLNPSHLDIWKINHDEDLILINDGSPL